MNRQPQLWIFAERPVRLPNALVAAGALRGRFPGGIHLVRDESDSWRPVNWAHYSHYFDQVHTFSRLKSCRSLLQLPRSYRETVERKRAVAALPIDPKSDALLCIAGVLGLSALAATTHPTVGKLLSISASSYERLTQVPDRTRFRFTTAGWLQNRIVEPLAGVERTLQLETRDDSGGDGARLVRLQKDPLEIFDRIVISSISGRELPSIDDRFVAARYPSVAELPGFFSAPPAGEPGKVLFFGTPFLLVRNLPPPNYIEHANRCLDYLRRHHRGRQLVYRPHPFETTEREHLDLSQFQIEQDGRPAEIYFLENFNSIEAVYSVSSTVSRRALTMGLDAFAFWRCFPFPSGAAQFFEKLMGAVPPEFEIEDLDRPPAFYQSSREIELQTRSFGDALKVAADFLATARHAHPQPDNGLH